jgi:Ca-activated chloride channel family protein
VEAELVVPVPDGATVRGFTFQGSAAEPTAALLPKDEARRTYDGIVAKMRDPALLEFIGYNLIKSSVFPLEPRGTQKVRLTYEHILPSDGNRVDYFLPRSERLDCSVPWKIAVRIKSKDTIATAYSPSHKIETKRADDGIMSVRVADDATADPGAFRLSYLLKTDTVSASLLAYPDPKKGGGYFLLLAGVPKPKVSDKQSPHPKRDLTIVLDRSGSMSGGKLDQVRQATLQILEALEDGETFSIIIYNDSIETFRSEPVPRTAENLKAARAFLDSQRALGGTNLHDALLDALRRKTPDGALPIVLFLTDGLPTVGERSERAIRDLVVKANPGKKCVFTFGVGVDVNTPLLEKLAADTRSRATFVLPKEDVEVKVGQVFKRLAGPMLSEPEMRVVDADGKPLDGRIQDLVPGALPDLFEDDQLVVLGRYTCEGALTFRLTGRSGDTLRTFNFPFELSKATVKNAFVPRLWASRKIAVLVDAIRQAGADGAANASDPKIKELTDEVVRLSTEFGILTEYTAFLAKEGTDLTKRDDVLAQARYNFQNRAIATRSGWGSVNQSFNGIAQMSQQSLNPRNEFYDEKMNRVEVTAVQQVNDRAFFRRGDRWVDSRNADANVKPHRTVEFGSPEHTSLAYRLAEDGRQSAMALDGDTLLVVDNEPVLIRNGTP